MKKKIIVPAAIIVFAVIAAAFCYLHPRVKPFLKILTAPLPPSPNASPLGDVVIDSIVVYKSKREMLVYSGGDLLKTYRVALGGQPVGAKEFEGDLKTPEGLYFINDRNPNSRYYKNLGVSYPNKDDIAHAKRHGKPAGGDIKIHGIGPHINPIAHKTDWTLGCIAVTDEEIDELYATVKTGARIMILP
ncbi:MAG: L,D-transpeptidase family protein [Chitinispirillia bacterium]|nr:L,D-transpeptidase family protein [Chitinispirillia bacterium]